MKHSNNIHGCIDQETVHDTCHNGLQFRHGIVNEALCLIYSIPIIASSWSHHLDEADMHNHAYGTHSKWHLDYQNTQSHTDAWLAAILC